MGVEKWRFGPYLGTTLPSPSRDFLLRWLTAATFQEMRKHLGFETQRQ
jgi:hypothetical protein